jgi:hypothetical protein
MFILKIKASKLFTSDIEPFKYLSIQRDNFIYKFNLYFIIKKLDLVKGQYYKITFLTSCNAFLNYILKINNFGEFNFAES